MSLDLIFFIWFDICSLSMALDFCYLKHNCPSVNPFFKKKHSKKGVHTEDCHNADSRYKQSKVHSVLQIVRNKLAHQPDFVNHPLLYKKNNEKMKMLVRFLILLEFNILKKV